jgi:hypothetical protein
MLVSDLVGTNIASLGESLLADITGEGLFARMASLMCLEIAQLGEALSARRLFAYLTAKCNVRS